jgi:O-antigen/teichoic acid export membrane protein
MLAFSAPLVPSSIAVVATSYVDRFAISVLMTISAVGVFGVGARIASILALALVGFQLALTPLVYARHSMAETPPELARLLRYFAASGLLAVVALTLFAPEIVALLAAPDFRDAQVVVPILGLATLVAGMYVFAPGLGVSKRSGLSSLVSISGAVAATALNFVLIPRLGIVGAPTATLIGAPVALLGYLLLGQRVYPIPHRWGPLAIAAITTYITAFVGTRVELAPGEWLVVRFAILIGAGLLVVAVGLVHIWELRGIVARLRRPVVGVDAVDR